MKIQSVCHLFHCQRCLFWLNFWPFHANWLQSLFVRVRRLSKVCEQQPVPSSSYSKFWKFLKAMKVGFMFLLKTRFKWVQKLYFTDIFSRENQFASCWDTWHSSGILQWAFQCSVWTQDLQFLVNVCVFFFELYFGFYCELHIELFFELCFVQRLRVPRRFWARAWCCGNVVFKDIVLFIVRAKCIASHKF